MAPFLGWEWVDETEKNVEIGRRVMGGLMGLEWVEETWLDELEVILQVMDRFTVDHVTLVA